MQDFPYTPAKRLHRTTLSVIHSTLLISTVIILLILVVSSVIMFLKGMNSSPQEQTEVRMEGIAKIDDENDATSSLSEKPIDLYVLERIEHQDKMIEAMEVRNESVLADLRQESNNIINKFNAWLGFWIAILAIFGGVVPIIIQYILREKSKREVAEMMEELRCRSLSHQMQLMVTSLDINKRNSIIKDSIVKEQFINLYKSECLKSLKELTDLSDNKQGFLDHTRELHLISILVQYCRLIDIERIDAKGEKLRKYNELYDKIKRLIVEILQHTRYSRTRIWNQLIDLIPRLSSI